MAWSDDRDELKHIKNDVGSQLALMECTGAGYQGHLIMTDEWFNEYTFRLVVETKYVTPKALEVLKQKPIRLPAWDPMFAGEE